MKHDFQVKPGLFQEIWLNFCFTKTVYSSRPEQCEKTKL